MTDTRKRLIEKIAWALRTVRQSWGYEDTAEQILQQFEYLFPDNPTERIAQLEAELTDTKQRLLWAKQSIEHCKTYWIRKADVQPRAHHGRGPGPQQGTRSHSTTDGCVACVSSSGACATSP